jgi:hypothetical protein
MTKTFKITFKITCSDRTTPEKASLVKKSRNISQVTMETEK